MHTANRTGLCALFVGVLLHATQTFALTIERILEPPECKSPSVIGVLNGECFFDPQPEPPIEAAFAEPPDRVLNFHLVFSHNQHVVLSFPNFVTWGFLISSPQPVTVNIDGVTMQDRFGQAVASTGPVGMVALPDGTVTSDSCENGADEFRLVCNSFLSTLPPFQQILLSFSMDATSEAQPLVHIWLPPAFCCVGEIVQVQEPSSVPLLALAMIVLIAARLKLNQSG
jgi:hypothetical protein